jgi:hypothetical protein
VPPLSRNRRAALSVLAALALASSACDLRYPELVVVNRIAIGIQVRDPSFNGCIHRGVLGYGEASPVLTCPPGDGRVHFQKLDVGAYAGDGDGEEPTPPLWFNYQTSSSRRTESGDFAVFELTADDMEQDFSVPGPYGH